jgi:cytochrome P450
MAAPRSASLLAEATGPLNEAEAISNAAVLMFGGIETTEGMITNAMLHLLSHPGELGLVRGRPRPDPRGDRGIAAAGTGCGGPRPLRDHGRAPGRCPYPGR